MNEGLFQALAQAEARPSKALRAVQSGAQAVNDTIGGVLQGQQIRQQLDQNRLLQTPLGSMYSDPSQIPFGLSPNHTVKDLMTLAPVMENFIPQSAAQGIVNMYTGGNVQNNSTGTNGAADPAAPSPSISSAQPDMMASHPSIVPPAPSIVRNPPMAQGQQNLDATEGTGTPSPALVPPGQPLRMPVAPTQPLNQPPASVMGNSGVSGVPSVQIPPGGIGRPAMQLLQPALNAAREGQQFQQGQAGENQRAANTISAEDARQQRSLDQARALANAGHMAIVADKIAPSLQEIGGVKNLISQIEPLIATNRPIPGLGNVEGSISNKLGGLGTPQMRQSLAINNAGGALSAALDKIIAGRFNENEANLLNQTLIPTGNDQPAYAQAKLQKLKGFVGTLEQGNDQAIKNMAAAITGGQINPNAPSGPAQSNQNSPQAQAIAWANANPNNPKAAAVRAKAMQELGQ